MSVRTLVRHDNLHVPIWRGNDKAPLKNRFEEREEKLINFLILKILMPQSLHKSNILHTCTSSQTCRHPENIYFLFFHYFRHYVTQPKALPPFYYPILFSLNTIVASAWLSLPDDTGNIWFSVSLPLLCRPSKGFQSNQSLKWDGSSIPKCWQLHQMAFQMQVDWDQTRTCFSVTDEMRLA